jgi:hypothetical protein
MKVVYTDVALRDPDEILEFIELHYPAISVAFEERLRAIERRIQPLSIPALLSHRRCVVEVLHTHHGARQEPWERND